MKKLIVIAVVVALAAPSIAMAQKKPATQSSAGKQVNEYGEDLSNNPDVVEQVAPAKAETKKAPAIQETAVGSGAPKAPAKPTKGTQAMASPKKEAKPQAPAAPAYQAPPSYGPTVNGRAKRFQVGLIGPGFAWVSRGYGPAMTFGFEGDYYFFEKLAVGARFEMETKFKSPTIISFVPHARYVFDFDNHSRWAAYIQAGVGVAIVAGGGTYVACDIAIPDGGFWWQGGEHWSVGGETSFHIYARSTVAVGWNIAPTFRYIF